MQTDTTNSATAANTTTTDYYYQTDDSRYMSDYDEDDALTLDALLEERRAELATQKRDEAAKLAVERLREVARFETMLQEHIAPVLYNALRPHVRWADDDSPAGGSLRGHAEATFSARGMAWVIRRLGAWYLYGPYGYRRIAHINVTRPTLFILDMLNEYPSWLKERQQERETEQAERPRFALNADMMSDEIPF